MQRNQRSTNSVADAFLDAVAPLMTLAALTIGGCGKSARDIALLPYRSPDEVAEQAASLLHHEIRIDGTPKFEADKSENELTMVAAPASDYPLKLDLERHNDYLYSLPCPKLPDGKLLLRTETKLKPDTVTVSGTVEQLKEGGIYVQITGSIQHTRE